MSQKSEINCVIVGAASPDKDKFKESLSRFNSQKAKEDPICFERFSGARRPKTGERVNVKLNSKTADVILIYYNQKDDPVNQWINNVVEFPFFIVANKTTDFNYEKPNFQHECIEYSEKDEESIKKVHEIVLRLGKEHREKELKKQQEAKKN